MVQILEMLRFVVFFSICYYSTRKTYKLLDNRKVVLIFLRLFFLTSLGINLILQTLIITKINLWWSSDRCDPNSIDPYLLCKSHLFQS